MSSTRDRRVEAAWAAFALACAAAMLLLPEWQTIPFHWIWLTLTFLYGFRRWSAARTCAVLAAVTAITTVAMLLPGRLAAEDPSELLEVPLMALIFIGMVWHVRSRQAAVDELRRSQERERQFMSEAAHNLRTPLTVAQGHAELLLGALPARTPEHEDAAILLDELRRLARISDDLLMLGTAGRAGSLLLAPVHLDVLLERVAGRWGATQSRRIEVRAPEPVVIHADEQRLRHALEVGAGTERNPAPDEPAALRLQPGRVT